MQEQEIRDSLYPVRLDRMMEALRFAEYDLTSGLGELVDNSVEAGAQNIWVKTKTTLTKTGKRMEVLDEIGVVDDGCGMSAEVLHKCLVLGEGHRPPRIGGPAHIGRFGVGLSLGGISLAQRIEVYSRDNAQAPFSFTVLDLTEIRQGKQTHITPPVTKDPPTEYAALLKNRSGTIVLLQKCDRLQYDTVGGRPVNAKHHIDGLVYYLGRTYRKFIDSGLKIWFNGETVYLHDPLYMLGPTFFDAKNPQKPDPKASLVGTAEIIELDVPDSNGAKANVTIRMSLLPKEWRTKQGMGGSPLARDRHIEDNEGVSILRANREVLYGPVPYIIGKKGQARFIDIDRWWGCEVEFPPELDNYFQVRYIKRGAEPLPMLRDMIRERIWNAVKELRIQIQRDMKQSDESLSLQEATFREAEDIMAEADKTSPRGKRNDTASEAQVEQQVEELIQKEVHIVPPVPTTPSVAPTLPTALTLPFITDGDQSNQSGSASIELDQTEPLQPELLQTTSEGNGNISTLPSSAEIEAERKRERKNEILKKPYSIVPMQYPGNMFFQTLHQMGRVVIKLNIEHPFYKEVFEPLCGSIEKMSEDSDVNVGADTPQKRKARQAFMLLLLSYGKGETFFEEDGQIEVLNSHREQWGIALANSVRKLTERG